MPGSLRVSLPSLAVLAWAASCSVFPDRAVLPAEVDAERGGGAGEPASAGRAGSGSRMSGGSDGEGLAGATGQGDGGAGAAAGADAGGAGAGGAGAGGAGAGGGAGVGGRGGGCEVPSTRAATLRADTWIEASRRNTQHSTDATLRVAGGSEESRALLTFSLPGTPAGTELLKATLTLTVQSNDDALLLARVFAVHELARQFVPNRTTWLNWSNGSSGRWSSEGGDFGAELASGALPAGSATGTVSFDVSSRVRSALTPEDVPLSLIVLEAGGSPPAPAEVAFVASEGDDSQEPELLLELCLP